MKHLISTIAAAAALSTAPATQTFSGTITDALCAVNGHAAMRMGPTDAECAKACAQEHDADFVLLDGKTIYSLSDQKAAERFAGKRVKVVGTLDPKGKTIQVESIAAN